jgi:hypothetical protein
MLSEKHGAWISKSDGTEIELEDEGKREIRSEEAIQ